MALGRPVHPAGSEGGRAAVPQGFRSLSLTAAEICLQITGPVTTIGVGTDPTAGDRFSVSCRAIGPTCSTVLLNSAASAMQASSVGGCTDAQLTATAALRAALALLAALDMRAELGGCGEIKNWSSHRQRGKAKQSATVA